MAFSVFFEGVSLRSALVVDVLGALATHIWFNRFEPSSYMTVIVALGVFPLPSAVLLNAHLSSTLRAVLLACFLFCATLLSSIVAYRISPFHPLAKHPGPLICKVSKLWTVWIASGGKLHLYHKKLHDRYGAIVRVGPNELSIIEKDLIPSILGTQGMPKGPLWDGRRITPSGVRGTYELIGTRDPHQHAQRRKAWNKAFASAPIKDYEEVLMHRALQLIEELERICRTAQAGVGHVDIAKWISFFSFDFMGDMAFGGGFELMRDGDKDGFWHNMEAGLYLPALSQHVPWVSRILRAMPFVGAKMRSFGAFVVERAKRRASQETKRKDLFYHLIEATSSDSLISPFPLIASNALLAIVAGSDTTASVLSNIIYYLLDSPVDYARLREELDKAFPLEDAALLDVEKLPNLVFLNAVINEALRLQPPVPTSLQRAPVRGSGGKMLGPYYIPEGTAIQVPPYALQRDPRYFMPSPNKFWPERWLDQRDGADVVVDRGAFIPFSYGPANCAGKTLAMLELRWLLALLVVKFDIFFEDGYNPSSWEDSLQDRFVIAKGDLPVKLRVRKRS